MVFVANPLSLSVPNPVFESWLRDTGYLEILDERTTVTDPSTPSSSSSDLLRRRTTAAATAITITASAAAAVQGSCFASAYSVLRTLVSIFTLNPFAKLTPEDFSNGTPSWTLGFVGGAGSYSWPAGPSQVRMRVQENVRRYARNYAFLSVLFLACSLYQMPVSLVGLISSLVIWELLRFCSNEWELEQRSPVLRQASLRIAQLVTAVILYLCNLHLALICTIIVSYAVMILHASLRKLTPSKQNQDKRRSRERKMQITAK